MKSFKEVSSTDPTSLMIVDSLNLGFRWKHSGALNFADEYIKTVESLAKSYKCGKIIIACDDGSSHYRKSIYPEYKQNRKDKALTQTPEEQEAFELFFKEYLKTIEMFREQGKYPVLKFSKTEADDIAGYIVKTRIKYPITKIVLVSSDRDWDLLIAEDVQRFSYVTRKDVTYDNWFDHYNWTPEDYVHIKCLQGDPGDNVPGVPKVGPVTALKLLAKYGTTYDIAASLPIPGTQVYIKNLNEFGCENLLRNYQLMDLIEYCNEALGTEACQTIDQTLERYLNVS